MSGAQRVIGKLLGVVLPDIVLASGINPSALSKDPQIVKKCMEDKRMIPILGPKTMRDIIIGAETLMTNAPTFDFPCLVIHGNSDTVTGHVGSGDFFHTIGSRDKTLKIIEGGYHELYNDYERGDFWKTIHNWMDDRYKGAKVINQIPLHLHAGFEPKQSTMAVFVYRMTLSFLAYCLFAWLVRFSQYRILIGNSLSRIVLGPLYAIYYMFKYQFK